VYDFDAGKLAKRVEQFIEDYNAEVSRWTRSERSIEVDLFVRYDKIKWSRNLKRDLQNERYAQFNAGSIRKSLYRPFSKKWLYYADIMVDERGTSGMFFPTHINENENTIICVAGLGADNQTFFAASTIIDIKCGISGNSGAQCFPYYTYAEDDGIGSNRRENITEWALKQFQTQYGSDVTKRDIFSYVYAILHHTQYYKRYSENLMRELPRIPLLKERSAFETCVRIGKRLMELHLNYEQAAEYPLKWVENREVPVNWRVEKMRLTPNKDTLVVNEWLTLTDIPQECFQYRLGNRSALEWVIDQYRVSTDARSGITSDPNRDDEPEYIVRLVGRVVTVSVETVKLVDELAKAVTQDDWMSEITTESTSHTLVQSIE
jgi:predicted helicase